MRPWARHATAGFTLIEAMVVVAMVAVLSAIAGPSFRTFIGTMNSKSAAFDLINDLAIARSEAIKRNQLTRVEPMAVGDWSKGWRITTAGITLREHASLASALSVTGAPSTLDFRPNGRVADDTADGNLAWSISSTIDGVTARCVIITPTGTARSKNGVCG